MKPFLTVMLLTLFACGTNEFQTTPGEFVVACDEHTSANNTDPGLLLRIENALQWPAGADNEPTVCHLSARICEWVEAKQPEGQSGDAPNYERPCHFLGTINAGRTQAYHLPASRIEELANRPEKQVVLQLFSSCQVSGHYFLAAPPFALHAELASGVQEVTAVVQKAHWAGYSSELTHSFTAGQRVD